MLRIHNERNGLDYVLVGDYYIPDIKAPEADNRPIGIWGRMHREYLRHRNQLLLNELTLTGRFHDYLADLNEQAAERCSRIMQQMMEAEDVTEELKRRDQMGWVRAMNSIRHRAEEIVKSELIYR